MERKLHQMSVYSDGTLLTLSNIKCGKLYEVKLSHYLTKPKNHVFPASLTRHGMVYNVDVETARAIIMALEDWNRNELKTTIVNVLYVDKSIYIRTNLLKVVE